MAHETTQTAAPSGETRACPSWCRADHTRDGHVHRVEVGHIETGGDRILVVILQTPDRTPNVVISGPVYVEVHGEDHADAARLFSRLGHRDLASLVDRAAAIVAAATGDTDQAGEPLDGDQGDSDKPEVSATVPGSWPGGEVASVRDTADQGDTAAVEPGAEDDTVRRVAHRAVQLRDLGGKLRDLADTMDGPVASKLRDLADAADRMCDAAAGCGGDGAQVADDLIEIIDRIRAFLARHRAAAGDGADVS